MLWTSPTQIAQAARSQNAAVQRVALLAETADGLRAFSPQAHEAILRRHSILMIAPGLSINDLAELRLIGGDVQSLPRQVDLPRFFPDRALGHALTAVLSSWRADVVITEGITTTALMAKVQARSGVHRIIPAMVSTYGALGAADVARTDVRQAYNQAQAILVPNVEMQRVIAQALGFEAGKKCVVVPPSAIDLSRQAQSVVPPLGSDVVVAVIERQDIELAERLCRHEDGSSVRIVDASGDSASAALLAAHLVLVPRRLSALTGGLVRSAASGRAIVGFDCPALRSIVDAGVNGLLVDTVDDLLGAVASLASRPGLLAAMGRASRLKIERRFDLRLANSAFCGALGLKDLR